MLHSIDKQALVFDDYSISYPQLLQYITATGDKFDFKEGEKVLLFGDNSIEWVVTLYAALRKGAIAVPVDSSSTQEEVAYIINDCRAEHIFLGNDKGDFYRNVVSQTEVRPSILTANEVREVTYDDYDPTPLKQREDDEVVVIIYTSGTTGSPKGVMLTYKNLVTNASNVSEGAEIIIAKYNTLIILPLHHILPLLGSLMAPLRIGSTVFLCSSLKPAVIGKALTQAQPGFFIGVPRLYDVFANGIRDKINASPIARLLYSIAKVINSKSFSRKIFKAVHVKFGGKLEHLVSGGAPLMHETGELFKVMGFNVLEGYGMTEASPMISFPRPNSWKLGTVGKAMEGCEYKIKDGEILARGPHIMKGYFNRPKETAEVLKDGWLYTGDLGKIDDEGYLIITGRKKEIIVTPNGKNINPNLIEEKLVTTYDTVADAGVFLHKDRLQVIIYPELTEVRDHAIENLGKVVKEVINDYNSSCTPYKKIMKYHIASAELPRTRLGKLQRFKLLELINEEKQVTSSIEEPKTEVYQFIKQFVFRETGKTPLPESHLEIDLGMDSLTKIALISYIENMFGMNIDEKTLSEYSTPLALSAYIEKHKSERKIVEIPVSWKEIIKNSEALTLPTSRFIHHFMNLTAKAFFRLYFKISKKGRNKFPQTPCIIVSNHQSSFDSFFVASMFNRKTFKKTYILAKEKHLRKHWMQFIAVRSNVIIMDINEDLKQSIQKMAQVIKKGQNLMIFPEGTRSEDGVLKEFRDVFAILSCELNVPVVPVAINGAYKALAKGRNFPKFMTKVSVEALDPLFPEKGESYDSLKRRVLEAIKMKIRN